MDIEAYCDSLDSHLTAWKAKIYDVMRIVERLPAADKETAFPSIRNLHTIVGEIDDQLEQLRHACPPDWSPNRRTIDEKMADLHATLKQLSKNVKGPIIPDSLAWVSE